MVILQQQGDSQSAINSTLGIFRHRVQCILKKFEESGQKKTS